MFLHVFLGSFLILMFIIIFTRGDYLAPLVVTAFISLACYSMGHPRLKSFAFTIWIFAFVAAAYYYPAAFFTDIILTRL